MVSLDVGALVVELLAHAIAPGEHGLGVPGGGHGEPRGPGRCGGGAPFVAEALWPVVHVDGRDVDAGVLGDVAHCGKWRKKFLRPQLLRSLPPSGLLMPPSGHIFPNPLTWGHIIYQKSNQYRDEYKHCC